MQKERYSLRSRIGGKFLVFAGRMLLCGLSIFVFATSPVTASNAVCAFRDIGFPGELIAASLTDGDCGGDDGTFVDIYRFPIFNENDLLDVTVTSSSFQPTFKVYRVENFSEPIILSSDTDGRAEFSIRNLFFGQYLLVVSSRLGSGSGSYTFHYFFNDNLFTPAAPQFDYDGGGGSDLSVFRPSNNTWYLRRYFGKPAAMRFGEVGDKMVPADYDGDRKTDIAMFRPSAGKWFIVQSRSQTMKVVNWGEEGDIPIAHRGSSFSASLYVFRPSNGTWYIRSAEDRFSTIRWGEAGDKPFIFGGPEMGYDVAVFRPSEGKWYFRYPFLFRGHQIVTWGEPGDIPVSADYDFDGKGDVGVYRPSTGQWFLIKSRHGDIQITQWGEPGDIPVPDDYLHDGRADLAVYRPSNNRWYFLSFDAQSQRSWSEKFGQPGDIPTNAAYRY